MVATLEIPAFRPWQQEECKFKYSLRYIARICLKKARARDMAQGQNTRLPCIRC